MLVNFPCRALTQRAFFAAGVAKSSPTGKNFLYVNELRREHSSMPRGPRGERRPADAIGAAVMVAKIATGELTEVVKPKSGRVRSGAAGAAARSKKLTAKKRREIAQKAAAARWE